MAGKYDFPKIDLHLHLDGAIEPKTLLEMARERNIELPVDTVEQLTPLMVCDPSVRSVNEYLKKFDLPIQVLQDAAALERIAYELVARSAAQGLGYAEMRFAPQQHTQQGLSQQDAVESVIRGIERGKIGNPNIDMGLILCAMVYGDESLNRDANKQTVEVAADYLGRGVCAFDLAGAEGLTPLSTFGYLFDRARELRLPFTCHAGDSQGPDTVRTAICEFGALRIGHGHHIAEDPALCRLARDLGATLEVCITSNIQCETQPSYKQHPIKKLYDMGLNVTLNTDNPIIAGITLDDEYDTAMAELGFTLEDIVTMNINAARGSFMSVPKKAAYIERLERYEDTLK